MALKKISAFLHLLKTVTGKQGYKIMKIETFFSSELEDRAPTHTSEKDNPLPTTLMLNKGANGSSQSGCRFGSGSLHTLVLTAMLALTSVAPQATSAQSINWNEIVSTLPNIVGSPTQLDLRDCEKPTTIEYFAHAGCPGYLSDLRDMNVTALRSSRAQFVLYLDGLITPLYGEKTFFVQGASFMHALPPRLLIKLKMLKLRTPEVIGLQLQDTLRMADRVVTPLLSETSGDPVTQLRNSMRQLGIDPLPSTVMPMLGAHDSYLLQLWAQEDPDGLADFMHRVQAVIDQL